MHLARYNLCLTRHDLLSTKHNLVLIPPIDIMLLPIFSVSLQAHFQSAINSRSTRVLLKTRYIYETQLPNKNRYYYISTHNLPRFLVTLIC